MCLRNFLHASTTTNYYVCRGNGVCDEYFAGTVDDAWNTPRGDYRFLWDALQEMMWPEPTRAELENGPFGDVVFRELHLREAGEQMCEEEEIPGAIFRI